MQQRERQLATLPARHGHRRTGDGGGSQSLSETNGGKRRGEKRRQIAQTPATRYWRPFLRKKRRKNCSMHGSSLLSSRLSFFLLSSSGKPAPVAAHRPSHVLATVSCRRRPGTYVQLVSPHISFLPLLSEGRNCIFPLPLPIFVGSPRFTVP